jgi:TP901 family phage tail tape measure protein
VDALVQGANSSATDVSGLGEAFKTSAPAAKLLGISVEGLATAVGLFTNAGITAGEAGTTLRNGLSQLGSAAPQTGAGMSNLTGQAKEAADVMKVLKLDIYNANGTLKPMETVLLQLKGAFDKLGPAAKIQLASKLFGGTDDGTKWLAVLNQSEDKIKAMATAMANTKGATDRNRDAMQGFQLTLQQLTGTLDSLGNNVGKIAAVALLPLVNAANTVVGAISALPGPVKDTVIALGLLSGAAVTAAAGMAVFQRVSELGVFRNIKGEVLDLAKGMRDNLGAGINAAKANIPGLLTQLQMIGQIKLDGADGAIKALGDALKNGLRNSIESAKASFVAFQAFLKSADFANFIAGAKSAVVSLGPLVLAIAGVQAAMASYNASTATSQKIAEVAADGQLALAEALGKAGLKTGELTTLNGPFARAWQNTSGAVEGFLGWLNQIPAIGGLVSAALRPLIQALGSLVNAFKSAWDNANATQGLENAAIALGNLQAQSAVAQNAAAKLFAELKNAGGTPNDAQTKQIQATAAALVAAGDQAGKLRDQYLQLAAAARNSGNEKLAKEYETLAKAADQDIQLSDVRLKQLNSLLPANQKVTAATEAQTEATKARAAAEKELDKIIAEAPVRALDQQLAVGQQLLGLAQAIGQAEQSRFAVTRSALDFELQQAEKRGASEQTIGAIKDRIAANDNAALSARYRQLQTEQQLQQAMLNLSQEKARTEANLAVLDARKQKLDLERELSRAATEEEKNKLNAQIALQQEIIGIAEGKRDILAQTQPLEQAALGFQQEAARNGLQAEAAAKGYKIALDGTLQPVSKLQELQGKISTVTKLSAEDQRRYAQLAAESGLAIGKAADGTIVLGKTQKDVNTAVEEMNRQLAGAKGGYDAAGTAAGKTKTATDDIRRSLESAGMPADKIADFLSDAEGNAKGVKGETDKLKTGLQQASTPASGIASAFVSTGKSAPAAAQGARDFASYLSSAKTFAERIAGLNLDRAMATVASETNKAADSARTFYDWLQKASNLPGSRWSGGPVEAGGEYKINELGQEAFLSAGRLSVINAPANSIWRAPSDGVVIPAGITAQLQARAAVQASGAGGGTAELAIEVGKLRQEVGNLARRDWSVHVQQRTGPTGSQVMRTLLS